MRLVHNIWIPDDDKFFKKQLGRVDPTRLYQQWKLDDALRYTPHHKRRLAVDVGASVGVFTLQLNYWFERVKAFEINENLYECFWANIEKYNYIDSNCEKIELYKTALGNYEGTCSIANKQESSLLSYVDTDGSGVEMKTLDSYEYDDLDFLKIDVEGYEINVLGGATETLKQNELVILVEHRGHEKRFGHAYQDLFNMLDRLGYNNVRDLKGDFVFTKGTFTTRPVNFDPDKPVAILGGGPSAEGLNLEKLQATTNLISINDSIKHTPNAMCFFTIDGTYFLNDPNPMGNFEGLIYVALPYDVFQQRELFKYSNIVRLDRAHYDNVSEDPLTVNVGKYKNGTSGRGAIDIAYLWGAKKILLFGFDGGPIERGNPTHWCRDSNHGRWGRERMLDVNEGYRISYNKCKDEGVEVLNASPGTQIGIFPVITHDEALP